MLGLGMGLGVGDRGTSGAARAQVGPAPALGAQPRDPSPKHSLSVAPTPLGPLPAIPEDPQNAGKKLSLCFGSPASLRKKHFCVVLRRDHPVLGSPGFQEDASTCQVLS